jgi:putative lipoic acid-binding regulatory protein
MQEPKIEFPCDYPVKVIVKLSPDIVSDIVAVLKKYDSGISADKVQQNPSKNGNYVSLRVQLWATGKPQLEQMFTELKQNKAVQMVL